MSLSMPDAERRDLIRRMDFDGVVQLTMIYALEKSAKVNGCAIKQEQYDGFYKYRGSIDTNYIAAAVGQAAREKIAFDQEAKEHGSSA